MKKAKTLWSAASLVGALIHNSSEARLATDSALLAPPKAVARLTVQTSLCFSNLQQAAARLLAKPPHS
jgi:anti-anti-sigma regulatory factor